jgi:hypothetical protein
VTWKPRQTNGYQPDSETREYYPKVRSGQPLRTGSPTVTALARWTGRHTAVAFAVLSRLGWRAGRSALLVVQPFSKVGHTWRRTRGTRSGRWTAHGALSATVALPSCRDGGGLLVSTWVLRSRDASAGRTWAVFPKSDANGGEGGSHSLSSQAVDSDGRWRHENAAGEAARRISALEMIRHWSRRE